MIVTSFQGLKFLGKQISSTFSCYLVNNALLYHFWANLLAHNKKNDRNLFCEDWSPEMTSQLSPVSVFGLAVLYPTGSEISRFWYIKRREREIVTEFFFAILISKLWRFYWANKKICHIHFKRTMPEALLMLLNIQTGERRAWLYQRPISFRFMYRMLSWAQVITLKLNLTEQSQTWS